MKYLHIYKDHNDIKSKVDYNPNIFYCKNEHIHYDNYDSYDAIVKYIESTGTQYIDTEIISQNNLIYDFYLEETQNNNQRRFFGFKEGNWLCPGMNDANWGSTFGIYVDFSNTENKIASLTYPSRNGHYYFDFTDGAAKFLNNNNQLWTSNLSGTYEGTRHVYIFSIDYKGQDQSNYIGIGRISYFKIIKNNILLFDGIPVRKGNKGYLYDRVTNKLFGNSGTGEFIVGPDVYDTEIEYIESTGTQYIDTGTKGDGKLKVECEFMPTQKNSSWNCVYGGRNEPGKNDFIYIYSNASTNNYGYVGYYNTVKNSFAAAFASVNKKHTIVQDRGKFILDGKLFHIIDNATFTSTANLYIFDASNNNTNGGYYGYLRLYSFKMYINNVLVRDFIPVRKGNIGYLYDKVTNQLFGNSGTGDFILGRDINNNEDNNNNYENNIYDRPIEYLESTGTQYINLNYIGKGSDIIEIRVRCTQLSGSFLTNTSQYPLYVPMFGVLNDNTHKYWAAYLKTSGTYPLFYYNTYNNGELFAGYTPKLSEQQVLEWHTFVFNKTVFTNDGVQLSTTVTQNGVSVSPDLINPMYLFHVNSGNFLNYLSGYTSWLQISHFTIKDTNGNLIIDLIPVRKGNKGYMYDKVSKQLFGNAGTGDFVLGPDIYDDEVEYIESTGTQWIDTMITPQQIITINSNLSITKPVVGNMVLLGALYDNSTIPKFQLYLKSDQTWGNFNTTYYYFNVTPSEAVVLNQKYNIIISGITAQNVNVTILLFARNNDSDAMLPIDGMRLYDCNIISNEIKLADFIPVSKNGIGYLYDKITNKLFGNSGTGNFLLGPSKNNNKPYDAIIEYLESTGTQYINTEIIPNSSLPFDCTFMNNGPISSGGYGNVFGARQASNSNEYQLTLYNNGTVSVGVRNNISMSVNNINHVTWDGSSKVICNNTASTVSKGTISLSNSTIILFGIMQNAVVTQLQAGRIYSCKFGDTAHFIPVRKGNVGYMYDKVTGQLFGNAGTGDFVLGPDIYDYELEYLQSSGTQYINTNLIHTVSNYEYYVDFTPLEDENETCIFGSSKSKYWDGQSWSTTNQLYIGSSKFDGYGFGRQANVRQTIKLVVSGTTIKVYKNNIKYFENTFSGSIISGYPIYLFAYTFGSNSASGLCKAKVHSFSIVMNNVKVFDGIPVSKNGVGYMYDKITNKLFGNSGTGNFILGPRNLSKKHLFYYNNSESFVNGIESNIVFSKNKNDINLDPNIIYNN